MPHVGGKNAKKKKTLSSSDSKRHFTVVMGNKEHGLYVSSSPSSAARKAVSKLCATDKKRKVQFSIREITQGSKKKTYGPYLGSIEKLKEPIELKGRVIRYKPVAKLSKKTGKKMKGGENEPLVTIDFILKTRITNLSCDSLFSIIDNLKRMNENIFDITETNYENSNGYDSIRLSIKFNNFSDIYKNTEKYHLNLKKLLELLKNIKKIKEKMNKFEKDYKLDITIAIQDEQYSEEYNNFIIEFKSEFDSM
jgi:hypothetical protein